MKVLVWEREWSLRNYDKKKGDKWIEPNVLGGRMAARL